ncbi:uncharacterized protein EI97DRAFT_270258 [Westerdykella ornata]|uniref:Uncharacterized protein n=1 Tax=Westerdykella ornata TaxID=318751 RepID=A0A6A6J5N2_WESOR|nr:uncharacterized protein EI97DRAFT_270258 [Westerdykella ornata]KAF2271443.1 hypothetical protein EI97DRAFT_270258 [Westerdykella ornata]
MHALKFGRKVQYKRGTRRQPNHPLVRAPTIAPIINMALSRYLVQFLSLATTSLAVNSEEASLIAWKAYGDLIKNYITANQPLTPGTDFIYVTPLTSTFVRGGTPCPESVTNFELYQFADRLQNSASPLLDTTGPLYAQTLETYLQSVAILDKELTPEQKKKLDQLEKNVNDAKTKFQKAKSSAFLAWRNDEVAQYFNQTFQAWVTDNDPQYANFQAQLVTADASYNNYMLSIYGSKYNLLQEQRNNINSKAQNELGSVPGPCRNETDFAHHHVVHPPTNVTNCTDSYNMMVYPSADSYNVSIDPFVKNEITESTIYRPAYSLTGYENTCDSYFRSTQGLTTLQYGFTNVDGHDWSSLGYTKKVTKGGGGLFGIIGYKKSGEQETTYYNSWSGSWAQDVKITVSMKGAPTLVPITAGFWDVGNVRKTYPKLREGETDDLQGLVRLTHVLVGYQLGMTIKFSNSEMWRNVSQFIETGKSSGGGSLQIFGFGFGKGGGGAYQHSTNDLKTRTTSDGGEIVIPNTPEGMLFMLGARGKAL